ncbi:hypothetical protein [Flavilitoribacter nigricans]|uniref:Uncharacterized protein n=1 Tax=Flavilitoribacter nigricans (strain ATCC 23147 / DSM 23189 / NBRC 102662 / NCIMB 1420 / SS-2) TaxID=1122177 RepID=A0A2D0N7M0_FLAN2|nr:hypothetical protein [Flavilitoribacter nigricans]PHN04485.1 hypothetical protein CRP01_20975 [Flavilitoribacter nigricans DSM 23189 = NBRC 102662]
MSSKSLNPSAPNKLLWLIAIVLGVLGLIGMLTPIEGISTYANTMILVAFLLLAIGTSFRGV